MFPISLTEADYKQAVTKRGRLDGVPIKAIAIIEHFQPYLQPNPKETVLGILDELTNVNKHRMVIFTTLHGFTSELPPSIPYLMGVVRNVDTEGTILKEVPMRGILTLQEGFTKNIEITNCIDTAARFISEEMLPLFEEFFK